MRSGHTQCIDRLVLRGNKLLHQFTKATYACACYKKDTSKEESSVNMKIFIDLKDFQAVRKHDNLVSD